MFRRIEVVAWIRKMIRYIEVHDAINEATNHWFAQQLRPQASGAPVSDSAVDQDPIQAALEAGDVSLEVRRKIAIETVERLWELLQDGELEAVVFNIFDRVERLPSERWLPPASIQALFEGCIWPFGRQNVLLNPGARHVLHFETVEFRKALHATPGTVDGATKPTTEQLVNFLLQIADGNATAEQCREQASDHFDCKISDGKFWRNAWQGVPAVQKRPRGTNNRSQKQ